MLSKLPWSHNNNAPTAEHREGKSASRSLKCLCFSNSSFCSCQQKWRQIQCVQHFERINLSGFVSWSVGHIEVAARSTTELFGAPSRSSPVINRTSLLASCQNGVATLMSKTAPLCGHLFPDNPVNAWSSDSPDSCVLRAKMSWVSSCTHDIYLAWPFVKQRSQSTWVTWTPGCWKKRCCAPLLGFFIVSQISLATPHPNHKIRVCDHSSVEEFPQGRPRCHAPSETDTPTFMTTYCRCRRWRRPRSARLPSYPSDSETWTENTTSWNSKSTMNCRGGRWSLITTIAVHRLCCTRQSGIPNAVLLVLRRVPEVHNSCLRYVVNHVTRLSEEEFCDFFRGNSGWFETCSGAPQRYKPCTSCKTKKLQRLCVREHERGTFFTWRATDLQELACFDTDEAVPERGRSHLARHIHALVRLHCRRFWQATQQHWRLRPQTPNFTWGQLGSEFLSSRWDEGTKLVCLEKNVGKTQNKTIS